MLTILEILIIAANIPVLLWALLPVKRVPRFLDFLPLASVIFLVLHLFIDKEAVILRFIPLYIFTITFFLVTLGRIFKHNPNMPKRRVLAGIGRIFGLLALVICVMIPVVVLPFYTLPEPTGSFNVGNVVCDLTDKNRVDTFSKDEGVLRKIAVEFWYPIDRTGSEVKYDVSNAPVSDMQQNYPVLVFSHGAFGVRRSNASTCRELASHGYIVASIDHTYHSFLTSFADGTKTPANAKFLNDVMAAQSGKLPEQEVFKLSHEWLELRTGDIKFLLDSLRSGELGEQGKLLTGHMNLDKIGLIGHSLGGAASAQVCRESKDVKAAIVIDGTMIGDVTGVNSKNMDVLTKENFSKPLFQMYGALYLEPEAKASSYLPNIEAFNNAKAPAYSLCIKDSGHLNFTDLPRISPFLSSLLGVGTVDSMECIKTVNSYSLAFFDQYLKGRNSPLLGSTVNNNQVVFEKRIK